METVPAAAAASDTRRMQTALIENVAREDLNPVDEARACAALVEDLGLSKEDLARRLGRTRPALSNLIRLLDLPDEVLGLLAEGELSEPRTRDPAGAEQRRGGCWRATLSPRAGRFARPRPGQARGAVGAEGDPTSRPGGGAVARRGGARGGVRTRGQGALGAQGHSRGLSFGNERLLEFARQVSRGQAGAASASGRQPLDRPQLALAAVAEPVVQAPDLPLPELDRQRARCRPNAPGAEPRRPRSASASPTSRSSSRRELSGSDWGDAQAPICESRGQAAK